MSLHEVHSIKITTVLYKYFKKYILVGIYKGNPERPEE